MFDGLFSGITTKNYNYWFGRIHQELPDDPSAKVFAVNENTIISGSYYNSNYTAEQKSQFVQIFSVLTEQMINAMNDGLPPESEAMQKAVQEHYDFTLQFWTPDRETYKSLAMNYILPTEFNQHYESQAAGLGKYIYKAVCFFADTNL